ncbi:hypothetical protein QFC22_003572 [Naganishia vaughanmartiniae]|uniref:Uncharacterized protein n=1 Tax=Naganishia vaughanmartiniae TaxID=1424756 RepID=A0ACC2X7P4_9TREE|nr:hypothetical protein QFC22_003572 [Naganishia vaughanmartiniae]
MSDQDAGYRGERNDPYSDGRTARRSESPRGDAAPTAGWEAGAAPAAENGGSAWEANNGSGGGQGGNWENRENRENNEGGRRAEEVQRGREGSENVAGTNLHVSGLAPRIDHEELVRFFSEIGPVEKASVMYDPHTKESRGFGFVMMKSNEDAMKVIADLDNKEFMGKCLRIQVARRARARTPTPGRYFGPPKAADGPPPRGGRFDDDSRYAPPGRGYDDRERGGGGYERGYERRYDDRRERDYRGYDDRPRYEERPRYDDRPPREAREYAPRDAPREAPRGGYEDRRGGGGGGGGYDRPRY